MIKIKTYIVLLFLVTYTLPDDSLSVSKMIGGWIMLGAGCSLVGGGIICRYHASEVYKEYLNRPLTLDETLERNER